MTTRKKRNIANKTNKRCKNKESDIKGLIIISIGILLAMAIYTNLAGALSVFSKKILYNLIGVLSFGLPVYLIYYGISIIKFKGIVEYTRKLIGITFLYIIVGLFFSTLAIQLTNMNGFNNTLKEILQNNKFILHGGLLGHLISYPLSKLIGYLGAYIIYFTFGIISVILLRDTTLIEVCSKLKNKLNFKYFNILGSTRKSNDINDIKVNDLSEDDKYVQDINNKIQILDFMKNSEVKDSDNFHNIIVTDTKIDNGHNESDISYTEPINVTNKEKKSVSSKDIDILIDSNNDNSIKLYTFPKLNILRSNSAKIKNGDKLDLYENANKLEETLNSFGVEAKVIKVTRGPSVTRFEIQPSPGVKVSKVVNLQDDIALGLAASAVRMEAPIPGKAAIGIEVPNRTQTPVFLKEVLDTKEFKESTKKIAFALGKDITGNCVVGDLSEMPHMLIAGATGSGKSVCINSLIISLLYKYSPDEVKLLMIDPKVVELSVYNGIPHLLIPVVTDPKKAAGALNWAVNEMDKRYDLFTKYKVKNIKSYNSQVDKGLIEKKLPYIVLIVDELADLMMTCPGDVEDYICRLAQKARAAGIHLIIATQRPSVDVITGVIKANIPSRISFAVSSGVDSRTILDQTGAEKLLGRGDMLYSPMGANKPIRVQGAFISEEEVENVVDFIKSSEENTFYEEEIINHINSNEVNSSVSGTNNLDIEDELLEDAIKIVAEYQQASTSFLQRKLRVGFNRASRIMEELEERGVISEKDGTKPRQVLISKEEIYNKQ